MSANQIIPAVVIFAIFWGIAIFWFCASRCVACRKKLFVFESCVVKTDKRFDMPAEYHAACWNKIKQQTHAG